ncbi:MAG TPA: GTPase Era [Rhodanobacteraceae bacterium]|nr:GTPase Era [Rhodanobacteraceae bacterium]
MSDSAKKAHRFGHVALVGRPNVGKSTLLNTLVGAPLSIVTPKPQTTRHRILGIATREDAQIVFIDTPGLHQGGKRAMNRQLNRVARQVPDEADVVVHVIDALRWTDEDEDVWRVISAHAKPRLLAINKVDRTPEKGKLLPFAAELARERAYDAVHFIAARRGSGVPALIDDIVARLPEGGAAYPDDEMTDRSERFLAAEFVREQLMLRFSAELPYAVAVEIERFEDSGGVAKIGAVIWVEREGQKAIVIGAGGRELKAIGTAARKSMERMFGRRVFLELWVRVRESWSDDEAALRKFGYSE